GLRCASKRSGGARRECLAWLNLVGFSRGVVGQRIRKRRVDAGEIRVVEDVEDLESQLAARSARWTDTFGDDQVCLPEVRSVNQVSLHVAERTRLRRGEGGRIQEQQPTVHNIGIHTWH